MDNMNSPIFVIMICLIGQFWSLVEVYIYRNSSTITSTPPPSFNLWMLDSVIITNLNKLNILDILLIDVDF